MRWYIILFLLISFRLHSQDYYSRLDGTWSLTNGGVDCACLPISNGNNNVFVNHTIDLSGNYIIKGNYSIIIKRVFFHN